MTNTESRLRAKLPGADTGIEVKHSICDICTMNYCGLDCFVKEGKIIKVEGTPDFPSNGGKVCLKGLSTRGYVYRKDRIRTPMRRTGPRGSGSYEPITWEEAYRSIAQALNRIKAQDGPEAVAWMTGFTKWYRPWLQRMVYSFGSQNYATESSACSLATTMAQRAISGGTYGYDLERSSVFLGWGFNNTVNDHTQMARMDAFKARGGKTIIVDPRVTPTSQRYADIHLQLRPGTDGALALGMANIMIQRGWADMEFIRRHVRGFEEYRDYAARFTPEESQRITGVPAALIEAAAELYATGGPASSYHPPATVTHRTNGYNNMRAVISLEVISGNLDRAGGELPYGPGSQYDLNVAHFIHDPKPAHCRERIGAERFPVWNALTDEFQSMDLVRQIQEKTPYPVKAVVGFGVNSRMFPQPDRFLKAMEELEMVVSVDLFMTDFSAWADIVLPACTTVERTELVSYGSKLYLTKPAIDPLYSSKNDVVIMCELAQRLDMQDDLLKSGYEATLRHLLQGTGLTLEQLWQADGPVEMPQGLISYQPGTMREKGFPTPTGKLELSSTVIEEIHKTRPDLDPLPTYRDSWDNSDPARFPLMLISGARMYHAVHSRTHDVPWLRSLRPQAAADIHPADAAALGVSEGDPIRLSTAFGAVVIRAHITAVAKPGQVYFYHGYREASANTLVGLDHLDPYSGFPGYRQLRCRVEKEEKA